jgi:CRP-like cAMP-binding protein
MPELSPLEDAAHKTGVGLEHIRKSLRCSSVWERDELTGELVAQALGVTRRSAARILVDWRRRDGRRAAVVPQERRGRR